MERISIGKMARMHCVSEKALRLYHEHGLLVPEEVDAATGYRFYSLRQSSQLDMIIQMKAIGMPLKEIRTVLEQRDIRYLGGLVEKHIVRIDERIRELKSSRKGAERLLNTCRAYLSKPAMDEIRLENLEPRRMLRFDVDAYPLDGGQGNAAKAMAAWELCLRQVKRILVLHDLPLSLFANVGCLIGPEDLRTRNLIVSGAFIFVDSDFTPPDDLRAETVPGGTFLTVCCDGLTTPEGGYRESLYLRKLLAVIEEKGFEITGDYMGEVLAETPAFLYEGREMMARLQIPVRVRPGTEL